MKNDSTKILEQKIKSKKALVGIIGLGYVGLPLALNFAKKGFSVFGIDINKQRIQKLKKAISYITDISDREIRDALKKKKFEVTRDAKVIRRLDAIIICVPTPLFKNRKPDISYIQVTATRIRENIRPGQVIVLESTTYPGTTREVVLPILESSGLKEGKDFYLAFSPERIDPGNETYKTENTPKVLGGVSKESTRIAKLLYARVIKRVVSVSSASAAEMVKLLENTFRIVNIALVNEIAILCNKFGIDIWEVINAAKTKPFGYMPFYPGPGTGGHCIPIDPLYLSWKAKKHGFRTKFIDLASSANEAMPHYIVERTRKILHERGKRIKSSNILVIGVAYKKDVKDLRESPALRIIKLLQKKKANVSYYDSNFPYLKTEGIDLKSVKLSEKTLKSFEYALLLTDHSDVNYRLLARNLNLIFDTRNKFSKLNIKSKNIIKL